MFCLQDKHLLNFFCVSTYLTLDVVILWQKSQIFTEAIYFMPDGTTDFMTTKYSQTQNFLITLIKFPSGFKKVVHQG